MKPHALALTLGPAPATCRGYAAAAASLLTALAVMGAARPATAQTNSVATADTAATVARGNDALYEQLGGRAGITALMDDFFTRLLADRRMNPFFKDSERAEVTEQLVLHFCQVSGGPCQPKQADMKKIHAGVDITRGDFNALVEVLQRSMDARRIAFGTQNRLLARLAPMHRAIVNSPP
jgi:hemoglobin